MQFDAAVVADAGQYPDWTGSCASAGAFNLVQALRIPNASTVTDRSTISAVSQPSLQSFVTDI
jgi:hypothetical protein